MGLCYIVGAGDVSERIYPMPGDLLIAADGGLRHLEAQGLSPDLTVGDFDSYGCVPNGENIVRLPVEKDETDTAVALREGFRRGYTDFCIYGGAGGREDHTYANIALLYRIAREGGHGFLVGNGFVRTVVVNRTLQIAPREGTLSVFSVTEKSEGVNILGAKYELRDGTLTSDTPLGVSNSFVGAPVEISAKAGALLVMWETA